MPINCGAVPKELLESELFGHRKGAFTGALADRIGRFELAHGGTLFLDEVGDLPLDMQVKLLRVLQERRIVPLGSNTPIQVDVRVIAATHKDMEQEVHQGRFREDLYYRLNVLPMYVCALRERAEDIPELLAHYARCHPDSNGRGVRFGADLVTALQRYHWPGNVRELCNLVDRFATFFPGQALNLRAIPDRLLPSGLARLKEQMERAGELLCAEERAQEGAGEADSVAGTLAQPDSVDDTSADDDMLGLLQLAQADTELSMKQAATGMPAANQNSRMVELLEAEGVSLKDKLVEIERSYIEQALIKTNWNVSATSRLLGLQRTTLIEKIMRLGLKKEDNCA